MILVVAAAIAALAFLLTGRVTPGAALRAVDLDLLLVLFALLVTVEILRASGWLDLIVQRLVGRFRTTRAFALGMVAFSGGLATLVTNDVTLFVVIPFTVIASRFSDFDVADAVVLEVVASIGCLTPLGNPQNLFLFHRSGWSAAQFVTAMLPFVLWSAAGLLIAIFLRLARRRHRLSARAVAVANLLGWRIYVRESNRDRRFLRRLTLINFAFLAWATSGGWLLLRVLEAQ